MEESHPCHRSTFVRNGEGGVGGGHGLGKIHRVLCFGGMVCWGGKLLDCRWCGCVSGVRLFVGVVMRDEKSDV